ncbi:hypothetical protein H6G25_13030 [Dolichospermum sp. FACHB-1091]|uniref:hypothetical protein n=1 Tax=Dolichospermum sp. FACHB-1091 TaxID=2692798 RepID=UPI0016815F7B|nr:hypothetical protein [Dolichospermum sp. FACHB-1091]MBD2444090.1 hypothetical protein [Dolichospermum sp. FACHB-1091]
MFIVGKSYDLSNVAGGTKDPYEYVGFDEKEKVHIFRTANQSALYQQSRFPVPKTEEHWVREID